ncbi:unnamed protein product, partial [Ixodes hexagonus]
AKLSYFHKPGKNPLVPWTIGEVVDKTADVKGDNTAVVSCHQKITKTFTQLRDDVNQFAASLVSFKLPVGSKIGMLAPNLYEWAVVQFAAAKAGLVLVNVNTAYQEPELEFCLNHVKCAAVIIAGKFSRQDYYEMLLHITPELERDLPGELRSTRVISLHHRNVLYDRLVLGTVTFDDLMESATAEDHAAMNAICSRLQFDDAVSIQFTSGSTGRPKAAQLSHFNVVNNANMIGRGFGLHKQDESICLNVPMMHCYGTVVGTLTAAIFGSTTVMPAPSFNAEAALECITKHRCTFIFGTPTMYVDMLAQLEQGQYDVSSVRKDAMGSDHLPIKVELTAEKPLSDKRQAPFIKWDDFRKAFGDLAPEHGLGIRIAEAVRIATKVFSVKIVNGQGNVVPLRERGELCVRGYLVFKGYYREEGKTSEVIRNNWYHTGDEATMSEDGRIMIWGRIKDMIIRGGENVCPKEIEDFLYTHPDVLEVQVVGVPDERLGEEACAWIRLKSGKMLSQEDIRNFCKGKISHFKIPRYVLFVDSFPKTEIGKIQKTEMLKESKKILSL